MPLERELELTGCGQRLALVQAGHAHAKEPDRPRRVEVAQQLPRHAEHGRQFVGGLAQTSRARMG